LVRIKVISAIFILILSGITSCTVEKRIYRKGYYVNRHKELSVQDKPALVQSKTFQAEGTAKKDPVLVSKGETLEAGIQPAMVNLRAPQRATLFTTDCEDLLTLRNGEEVKVKVIEISQTEIKYKRCDTPDGPLISVYKSDVFMIKYANGTKEVFKEAPPKRQSGNPPVTQERARENGFATASYSLGLMVLLLGGFTALPAIITGVIALHQINANPGKYYGRDKAISGIIYGAVYLLVIALILFLVLAV